MSQRDTRRDTAVSRARLGPRHPRSGSAQTDELGAFKGLAWGLPLGALLWALLLGACATSDPVVEQALRSYDAATRLGLAAERPVMRPYARVNDGAPWSQVRRVEIDR